jgi:hypothetical protein
MSVSLSVTTVTRALLPLALLAAAPALATSTFPSVVKDALGLSSAPSCTLCHASAGGGGVASKPFAASAKAAGLVPYDDASLQAALSQLETDGTDSDGDGASDIDELHAGTDPNVADGGPAPDPIQYGFGCRASPGAPSGALALLLLALRGWRRGPCPRPTRTRTPARTSPRARPSPR